MKQVTNDILFKKESNDTLLPNFLLCDNTSINQTLRTHIEEKDQNGYFVPFCPNFLSQIRLFKFELCQVPKANIGWYKDYNVF